jgi:hypothetical protein
MDNMLRLIVGSAPGARSALWRIFNSGDDVYVQHDGMRKDLKTSLHASGANHTAWTAAGAERLNPDGDRYMMKWDEPQDFAPGGKNLLGIVIPSAHLQVPDEEPPLAKREKITLLAPRGLQSRPRADGIGVRTCRRSFVRRSSRRATPPTPPAPRL